MQTDLDLLRQYAESGSESAFAEIVHRHVNLVYTSALRQLGDPHLAEEVSQITFLILARKAAALPNTTVLSGWLYRTARFAARDALKSRRRREHREQEAFQMQNNPCDSSWHQIAPLLDEAMESLGDTDRNAVVLRFFEQKPLADVGLALGIKEDAAHKRVTRAVDKLRAFLVKRGLVLSAAAVAGALSANAIHAAPVTLPATIVGAAAKGTAAVSASALIKGTLKLMAWTKLKTAAVAGIGVLIVAGATVTVTQIEARRPYPWQVPELDENIVHRVPPQVRIVPTRFPGGGWGSFGNNALIGMDYPLIEILGWATGWSQDSREAVPPDLTNEGQKYDFIANLPQGSAEALQSLIKDKFGLTGQRETRETDVLFLRVKNAGAPGLRPAAANSANSWNGRGGIYSVRADPFLNLRRFIEDYLHVPVVNQTGIDEKVDLDLKWDAATWGQNPDGLKKVLLDELGLELVPGRESIEMLVVEKVK